MNDHNNISDNEIRNLLKKRLLEHVDDNLLQAETKIAFGSKPLIIPTIEKEKELLEKLKGRKGVGAFKRWILSGGIAIAILSALLYHHSNKKNQQITSTIKNNAISKIGTNGVVSDDNRTTTTINDGDTVFVRNNTNKHLYRNMYRGQIIEKILKENADCTNPIVIKDTIVFSPHTPKDHGNEMEVFDNQKDDPLYFENEHNTVWYKFSAIETGQLAFDIIPMDENDDYDFMLYKWNGGDFRSKVMNKKIKPIRTCISRNDKKLKSMTGLSFDESLEPYVHSGEGAAYVKYINVQKGETFYLLVDNVYANGKGHTLRFHYNPIKPGELYIGKSFVWEHITFKDSDDEFKPGSGYEKALDSLYTFLIVNPNIKIEIQGHVNTAGVSNSPTKLPGKPAYTDLQLSEQRALVIYKFLVKKGIDGKRLTTNGFGGMRKKILHPTTAKECYMNIRVEILITSLDYKKDLERMKKFKVRE